METHFEPMARNRDFLFFDFGIAKLGILILEL